MNCCGWWISSAISCGGISACAGGALVTLGLPALVAWFSEATRRVRNWADVSVEFAITGPTALAESSSDTEAAFAKGAI